jgi:putative ABC transport system permease protein
MKDESGRMKNFFTFILHPSSFILQIMSVIWAKVWFDLWHRKTRTLLAVLSIAAGVFAIGAMFGMSDQMLTGMDEAHRAVNPSHITVSFNTLVDRDTVIDLKNVPGVAGVQPLSQNTVKYKVAPDAPWKQGVVLTLDDFDEQKYQVVQLKAGRWPKRDDIGIERMAGQFLNKDFGDTIIFKIGNAEREFPISGKIRHPFVPPPMFFDLAFFFMNAQGMERLGIPEGRFNSAYINVTPYSEDHAKQVMSVVKERLAKQNIGIAAVQYQEPDKHWGRQFMEGFVLVMQLLAVVSLVMSVVLVYNTVNALVTQQTDQIGILKAIGGRSTTIVQVYLAGVFVYGLLALVIALPFGAMVAFGITQYFLNLFNIDYFDFRVSDNAIIYQTISALAVPLLAGVVPVLGGARLTVRQAIASYGLGADFGSSWLDRLIERVGARFLPAHYATALGNMFRRKGRLFLTQFVLVTAGTMFLMVMSLGSSISLTLDKIYERRKFDSTIQFARSQWIERTIEIAKLIEGVENAEIRYGHSANVLVGGKQTKEAGVGTSIEGVPPGSDFLIPFMVGGRWLQRGDGNVVVMTNDLAKRSKVAVGDSITLDMGELGKSDWLIIGLYDPVFAGGFNDDVIYVPQDALFTTTQRLSRGGTMYVRTTARDRTSVIAINTRLKELFEERGIKVAISITEVENRAGNEAQFSIITLMMLTLAIIIAIVGGLALMGTLSISVVERTKEIGVLRAVGARSPTIMGMFVMEGTLQGFASWVIAVPLSLIISPPLANALGQTMFNANLYYQFNGGAIITWLIIILIISTLASILPARNATRISVRDSLAYS